MVNIKKIKIIDILCLISLSRVVNIVGFWYSSVTLTFLTLVEMHSGLHSFCTTILPDRGNGLKLRYTISIQHFRSMVNLPHHQQGHESRNRIKSLVVTTRQFKKPLPIVDINVFFLLVGSSGPGSNPGRGHCIVFLGKTLEYQVSISGVKMGTGKFNAGGNPLMD